MTPQAPQTRKACDNTASTKPSAVHVPVGGWGDGALWVGWLSGGPVLGLLVLGGESVQVVGGGEEVEAGVDFGAPSDPGSAAAVAAEHEIAEFPFDFRSRGPVVALPVRVGLLLAGFSEGWFLAADIDGRTRLGVRAVFPDSAVPVSMCTYLESNATLRTDHSEISMSPVWRIPRGFDPSGSGLSRARDAQRRVAGWSPGRRLLGRGSRRWAGAGISGRSGESRRTDCSHSGESKANASSTSAWHGFSS